MFCLKWFNQKSIDVGFTWTFFVRVIHSAWAPLWIKTNDRATSPPCYSVQQLQTSSVTFSKDSSTETYLVALRFTEDLFNPGTLYFDCKYNLPKTWLRSQPPVYLVTPSWNLRSTNSPALKATFDANVQLLWELLEVLIQRCVFWRL